MNSKFLSRVIAKNRKLWLTNICSNNNDALCYQLFFVIDSFYNNNNNMSVELFIQ